MKKKNIRFLKNFFLVDRRDQLIILVYHINNICNEKSLKKLTSPDPVTASPLGTVKHEDED